VISTACLIARNEAPYMVEWLGHYLCLGFDRIVVYDNGSTDGTGAVVRAAGLDFPGVELRPWPDQPGQAPQLSAYADAVARCRTEWIGFFDADELLVLKQHDGIAAFLRRYPADAGQVAINWLMFGSSGHLHYRDELQARRFRLAAGPERWTKNRFTKVLARTRAIAQPRVHSVDLKPGFRSYDDALRPVTFEDYAKTAAPSHEYAQLNHYVVRSLQEFADKRRRGNATRAPGAADRQGHRDGEEFWRTHDRNDVPDAAIDRWTEMAEPFREAILRRVGGHRPGVAANGMGGAPC
jgi:hypothetical protein